MAPELTEFETMMGHAMPYAKLCGDIAGFARACAEEVQRSGEPAFYLTAKKASSDSQRFPIALEMHGYDDANERSFLVSEMEISRPDYKSNPHGFKGNHLVVALLESARKELASLIPDGIAVLTSQAKWGDLIRGDGYRELKTQRALTRSVPLAKEAAAPRRASRL